MRCVGIDIGGTKIRAILWNGRRVVRAMESRTPKNGPDFIGTLLALALMVSRGKPVRAIGIGAAGIVEKTTLTSSPNIPFIQNFDFRLLWPRSVRLRVDNDARCFARAELLRGAGRGAKSCFALTIGTDVGRAYGRNRKIVKLKEFEYPEPWENEYQQVRKRRDDGKLADLLGRQLVPLIAPFEPAIIVTFVSADEAKYKEVVPGVSKAVLWGNPDKGSYGAFTKFTPGLDNGMHAHTNDVWLVVIKGAYLYKDDAGQKRVSAGKFIRIPAKTKHWSGGDAKEGALFYEEASGKFDLVPAK